ncbi:ABC transporter substrate-binding protein [Actinomadura fibrosa]|uniref:ABC transporter substrate-binding protein n=1 Tax=Actinomadura fibrosa TaxID=111802 RepID=A0ABW2XNC5_9ACTN|nr:ABC transporter substrate-binding protein [Actinomadura fibrosa]
MRQPSGRRFTALVTGVALAAGLASGCGSGSGAAKKITFWHGYTDAQATAIGRLAGEWNAAHPKQQVQPVFSNNDNTLQKTLASFVSGKAPSIAYQYGSSLSALTGRRQTQDLTSLVNGSPDVNWNDFFPAARQGATASGKIYGVPALVDNLGLVYNKKLFDAAGVGYPKPTWTWDDFRSAAKKLTGDKRYGWAYVSDGTEDTVWRFLALLWQAGGDLLGAGDKEAAFDSPAGQQAMQLLADMAVTDKSVYLDAGDQQYLNLFNSGRVAMMWTGPWDLGQINKGVSYGVQYLPGKVTHASVSGPDIYMIFDRKAKDAAWPFLKWLTSAEVHLRFAEQTGDLPLRASEQKLPAYKSYLAKYPGNKVFIDNLNQNVTKARPNIPEYPRISQVLGTAVQAVLLGKKKPGPALAEAAAEVDRILAGS